ncbi:GbsR/MarR family transcriptional regulator [Allosalinactinospora lopnorensis]|uniref:GbsR/MarR family transcriptional regulator n=1 Tax=Allosalinactinospora lopnorensis TaxID=1352348 RepID=UPI000623CF1C|nr:MarR family transcriptional regulator [Allosalinactinospora lopnorensis]
MSDADSAGEPTGSSTAAELAYVEKFAVLLEHMGLVRMHGRVLALLLVCEPPEQSAPDICAALQASKGSINPALRTLTAAALVEKVAKPGHRRDYYRIKSDAWTQIMRTRASRFTPVIEAADEGIATLADSPPGRLDRLREMRDFYRWFDQELPQLIERWEQWQTQNRANE